MQKELEKVSGTLLTDNDSVVSKKEVKLRQATSEVDLPAIVALAKEAHEESHFGDIAFSDSKVRKIALAAFDDSKRHAVILAERAGRPVGFVYCSVGEFYIGSNALLTTIHNLNVSKSIRSNLSGGRAALRLFRGVELWSEARGAKRILFHVTSNVNLAQTHKLAKKVGYRFIGGSYEKSS